MRVVIDTNILMSAALKQSSIPAAALHWALRHDTLLESADTEAELLEVLKRPKLARLIPTPSRRWLVRIVKSAEHVVITERIAVCRDPDDDKFIEAAVNGQADFIVSGDA